MAAQATTVNLSSLHQFAEELPSAPRTGSLLVDASMKHFRHIEVQQKNLSNELRGLAVLIAIVGLATLGVSTALYFKLV